MKRPPLARLLALTLFAGITASLPALIIVRQDGGGDALTIADGILLAAPGEEVRVTDGATYNEANLFVFAGMQLVSDPPGAVIDAGAATAVQIGGTGGELLEGFTISSTGAEAVLVGGFDGSTSTIRDCAIDGLNAAIRLNGFGGAPSPVTIVGCTITGDGIGLVVDPSTSSAMPFLLDATSIATLDVGVLLETPATYRLENGSSISSGSDGVRVSSGAAGTILELTDASITNCGLAGLRLSEGNVTATITRTDLTGNQTGIASFPAPFSPTTTFVLTGPGAVSANAEQNVALGEATSFTADAYAFDDLTGVGSPPFASIHAFSAGETTLALTDCTIQNNDGHGLFGQVLAGSTTGAPWTLTDCAVRDNDGHGLFGQVLAGASASAAWSLADCDLARNEFSELRVESAEPAGIVLSLTRTRLTEKVGGSSSDALLFVDRVPTTLRNCILDLGQAIGFEVGDGTETIVLEHCTIASASFLSGINSSSARTISLRNSILDLPNGTALLDPVGGVTIWDEDFNLLRGASNPPFTPPLGPNSLSADPLFAVASSGPGTGDFDLVTGSPAHGAGDPTVDLIDDIGGALRPNPPATNPDLGAIETAFVPVELSGFTLD